MEIKKTGAKGDFVETNVSNKEDKKQKEVKKTNKNKKPGFFKKIGMKLKDVFSEIKRVTWPSFPKVVKRTGVVLVVVLIFLVVITAFDAGLLKLLQLISPR